MWFLPRDAMRRRGLCYRPVSVGLSVRPSLCLSRLCIVPTTQTVEDIVKLLWPGSPSF